MEVLFVLALIVGVFTAFVKTMTINALRDENKQLKHHIENLRRMIVKNQ